MIRPGKQPNEYKGLVICLTGGQDKIKYAAGFMCWDIYNLLEVKPRC